MVDIYLGTGIRKRRLVSRNKITNCASRHPCWSQARRSPQKKKIISLRLLGVGTGYTWTDKIYFGKSPTTDAST